VIFLAAKLLRLVDSRASWYSGIKKGRDLSPMFVRVG